MEVEVDRNMKVLVQPVSGEVSILMRLANSLEDFDIFSLMFDLCCFTFGSLHYFRPRIMAKKMGTSFFRLFLLEPPKKNTALGRFTSGRKKKCIFFGQKRCNFRVFPGKGWEKKGCREESGKLVAVKVARPGRRQRRPAVFGWKGVEVPSIGTNFLVDFLKKDLMANLNFWFLR